MPADTTPSSRRAFLTAAATAGLVPLTQANGQPVLTQGPPVAPETWVSLADFGYVGDYDAATGRGTDDSAAWRAAIAAADLAKVATVVVPWGKTGGSRVASSIVDGTLPEGLTFVASGPSTVMGPGAVTLWYTGADTCWNIDHRGVGGSRGRWTWRGLTFRTTRGGATMFDFNRAASHGVVRDDDPQRYSAVEQIRFESCTFQGAGAGTGQTGDAIRAAKAFHLIVDDSCFIRDFRRGVWLYGCDNCTIGARSFLCARSVMIEASGTFGNDNKVTSRFLGGSPETASEDIYFFWDNANSTTLHETYFEELHNAQARALMYLDGYETLLLRPHWAGKPVFRLGPHGREITILHPSITVPSPQHAPIIDPPVSWDFGNEQQDFRATIIAATKNTQITIGTHPRLLHIGKAPATAQSEALPIPVDQSRDMLADARGYRPRAHLLSALNYWAKAAGTAASGGIGGMVPDRRASGGWAIRLDPAIGQGGLAVQFVVGRDVMPGDRVQLSMRARTADSKGWFSVIERIGKGFAKAVPLPADATRYRMVRHIVDLADWTAGDTLQHVIYQGERPVADVHIDYIEYRVVPAPVSVPIGGAVRDEEARRTIERILALLDARSDEAPGA